MAALNTLADYLSESRTLLQDTIVPYRYSDATLVSALNQGIQESRRSRPDLWLGQSALPAYDAGSTSTAVAIDQMYRMAFVYYMCGRAQLSDQEDTEDQRALAFLGKFNSTLTGAGA